MHHFVEHWRRRVLDLAHGIPCLDPAGSVGRNGLGFEGAGALLLFFLEAFETMVCPLYERRNPGAAV
jgi:hypothetical protein